MADTPVGGNERDDSLDETTIRYLLYNENLTKRHPGDLPRSPFPVHYVFGFCARALRYLDTSNFERKQTDLSARGGDASLSKL